MMNKIGILFFTLACLSGAGCYYDTQVGLYGISQCVTDTVNVTYAGKIAKIITNNCGVCHAGPSATGGGGIVLDDFNDFQNQAVNGRLMGDINQTPGFNAMPPNGNALTPCQIATIQHWLDTGTPSN
jgi:hypothetical protein